MNTRSNPKKTLAYALLAALAAICSAPLPGCDAPGGIRQLAGRWVSSQSPSLLQIDGQGNVQMIAPGGAVVMRSTAPLVAAGQEYQTEMADAAGKRITVKIKLVAANLTVEVPTGDEALPSRQFVYGRVP